MFSSSCALFLIRLSSEVSFMSIREYAISLLIWSAHESAATLTRFPIYPASKQFPCVSIRLPRRGLTPCDIQGEDDQLRKVYHLPRSDLSGCCSFQCAAHSHP